MKLVFSMLFLLCLCKQISAQSKIWNNWYFGSRGQGLNFNTTPPSLLDATGNTASTLNACAAISNTSGELLFYTNGYIVWDKDHSPMPNGTAINQTLSGDVLIVPMPEDSTLYYLFTASPDSCLKYSIIDMTLNHGKGDIINNRKNNILHCGGYGRVVATHHKNRRDFWILALSKKKGAFQAYLLTPKGLETTPVSSDLGVVINKNENWFSTQQRLDFSPDGSKFAITTAFDSLAFYWFNNTSGEVKRNPAASSVGLSPLPQGGYPGVFGICFSPSGKFAYAIINTLTMFGTQVFGTALYQIDLRDRDKPGVTTIFAQPTSNLHGLELTPHGEIYTLPLPSSSNKRGELISLKAPDKPGNNCNLQIDPRVTSDHSFAYLNFPNIITSFYVSSFSASSACFPRATAFTAYPYGNASALTWHFGDGTTSTQTKPSHTYSVPGTYEVSLAVRYQDGSQDTVRREVTVFEQPLKPMIAHE